MTTPRERLGRAYPLIDPRPPSAPRGSEGHPRAIEGDRASAPRSAGAGAAALDLSEPLAGGPAGSRAPVVGTLAFTVHQLELARAGQIPSPRRWSGETPLADRGAIVDGAGDAPAECPHRYVEAHTGRCDSCGHPAQPPVVLIPSPKRNPDAT